MTLSPSCKPMNVKAMLDRKIAPPISDFPRLSLPDFQETKLSTGIRLLSLNSGDEAVTRLSLLWPVGLMDVDSPAACGLMANFLSEGCGHLSGKEVSDILEHNGAWFKASPTQHSLLLTLHSLNHTAPDVLPLIGEMISTPNFPADTLESIKKKRAAEKEITSRKPSYQATLLARQVLYGEKHPLASVVTPEDIMSVEKDELSGLHRAMMLANKPVVFLSGKITNDIESLLENVLCSIPFDETLPERTDRCIRVPSPFFSRQTCRKEMPDSLQTGIRVQIPVINRKHPDYEALRFTVTALGGYFGSRLMTNIREDKGYTYGIGASLIPSLEGANVIISCECDNRYTDAVVQEIWKEIDRLANEEMPDWEIRTVRNIMISNLAGILDSPFSISSFLEQTESFGLKPEIYNTQFSEAMSITSGKLRETAAKYLSASPAVTALAGGKPG